MVNGIKSNLLIWLYILVLTVFSILINGYFFESEVSIHTSVDVPLFKAYNDKALYPSDIGKAVLPYYYTAAFPIISFLMKYTDIQYLFFSIFFIFSFLTFLLIFYVAKLLFKYDKVALFSVLIFIVNKPGLAQSTLFSAFAERIIAMPIFLLGIYFFLKDRYIISFILAGIAMNVHPILGLPFFAILLFYTLLNLGWRKFFGYSLIFSVFSSPVFLWKFLTPLKNPFLLAPEQWLNLLRVFHVWHLFPFSWPIGKWIRFFAFFVLFLIAFQYKPINKNNHKKVITLVWGVIILALIGTIFSEFLPAPIILNMQLFRAIVFLQIFGIIYLSNYLLKLLKSNDIVIGAGIAASVFISNFKGILIFLILLLPSFFKLKVKRLLSIVAIVFFILSVIGTLYPEMPIISIFKLGMLPLFLIVSSCVFAWLVFLLDGRGLKIKNLYRSTLAFILIILIISSLYLIALRFIIAEYKPSLALLDQQIGELAMIGFIREPYDPFSFNSFKAFLEQPVKIFQKSVQFPLKIPFSAWEEVQVWAKENTQKDSIFITPPYIRGFRVYSERSIVAECSDVAQANPFCIHGAIWLPRAEALCDTKFDNKTYFCYPENCKYSSLKEDDINKIARKYKANYIVMEKPKKLNFEKVFENDKFRVYKLKVESRIVEESSYVNLIKLENANWCN